ncbi:polyprenyl synthetase family protein [Bacillus kwashiorkori]|uniref:polyprenyl synthetase family protein n=1 Tax=Bacillus kwashiorkori TaxID=1522318 RepID=UPI0007818267|nr:polyprenyl synthetase family protein [Bacillus kwashiorkori]
MHVHPMWNTYPDLQQDLLEVVRLIDKSIHIRNKRIEKIISEQIHSGGKLLRPAYALLSSKIGKETNKERAIAVAAALECLHMATLVHDDVIDEAETRHNIPAIHTEYGNKFAIYAGDYLFCLCFQILAKHASSVSNLEFNTRGMEKILTGELDQLHSRYERPESVKNYLSRISGKTAQLFAISCYAGAVESNANRKLTMIAWNMGHYIGMAFQIMDDVLDYKGDSQKVGKPVLSDFRQGIYTLPLIYALRENPVVFEPLLEKRDDLTEEDIDNLLNLINKYDGVKKAEKLAERYTKKAIKEIGKLPEGQYKETLLALTNFLLERKM